MSKERYIFNLLVQHSCIDLNDRDDIGLYDIIHFITKYSPEEIIEYSNGKISLTKNGFDYVIKNRKKIFLKKCNKSWEEIPSEFLIKRIETNKVYSLKLGGYRHTRH